MKTIEQSSVIEEGRDETRLKADESVSVVTNGLHDALKERADSFDVSGFKCAKCGLVHQHDTTKHRLSDTFDVDPEEISVAAEYNPVCHCGVQEASNRGSDFGIDEAEASTIAKDAPVPPGTI